MTSLEKDAELLHQCETALWLAARAASWQEGDLLQSLCERLPEIDKLIAEADSRLSKFFFDISDEILASLQDYRSWLADGDSNSLHPDPQREVQYNELVEKAHVLYRRVTS